MGGTTYSIQYFTDSKQKLDDYYTYHAPRLHEGRCVCLEIKC